MKLNLDKVTYVEQYGLSSGLALGWRKNIDVHIHYKDESMNDKTINLNKTTGTILITWVYGSTNWHQQLMLWEQLWDISRTRSESRVFIRDFNKI